MATGATILRYRGLHHDCFDYVDSRLKFQMGSALLTSDNILDYSGQGYLWLNEDSFCKTLCATRPNETLVYSDKYN